MKVAAFLATALATLLVLLGVSVHADHAGGGPSPGGPGPLVVALMWGGSAFVVGMLVVAVVARLTRRPPPEDGETP